MKFGGQSQFGRASFGGDPYGLDPGYVVRRIIASLSRFKKTASGGFVRTLKRLTGKLDDAETWAQIAQEGTPAYLVAYLPGTFEPKAANNSVHIQTVRFAVVCVASDFRDRIYRLEGKNIYQPGLDNMARWALRFVGRELLTIKQLQSPRPVSQRQLSFASEGFADVIEFEAQTSIEYYTGHAELTAKLEKLGICHSPTDPSDLFADDNETPNSSDDASPGGVAAL